MQLSETDAVYAASKFINYFSNTGRIDEYLRTVKLDRIADQPQSLFGMRPEDDLFSDFDMHPEDMDIKVYPAGEKDRQDSFQNEYFNERLQITMSHAFETSIPGKSLKWIVQEKNTNKTLGFIRFGSPTINSKPRNECGVIRQNLVDSIVMQSWDLLLSLLSRLVSIIWVVNS